MSFASSQWLKHIHVLPPRLRVRFCVSSTRFLLNAYKQQTHKVYAAKERETKNKKLTQPLFLVAEGVPLGYSFWQSLPIFTNAMRRFHAACEFFFFFFGKKTIVTNNIGHTFHVTNRNSSVVSRIQFPSLSNTLHWSFPFFPPRHIAITIAAHRNTFTESMCTHTRFTSCIWVSHMIQHYMLCVWCASPNKLLLRLLPFRIYGTTGHTNTWVRCEHLAEVFCYRIYFATVP